MELYVVTDSRLVRRSAGAWPRGAGAWPRAGRGRGGSKAQASLRLPAERLLFSSSSSWGAERLCASGCWRW